MSSKKVCSNQVGDDVAQALPQPKIISNDVIIEPENLKQDKDDSNPVLLETKLTNQVVEPMSRGNVDDETANAARANKEPGKKAKTSSKGAKTNSRGAGESSNKLTRKDSMDSGECCDSMGLPECCCKCLAEGCECFQWLLRIPCMVADTIVDCLCCFLCFDAICSDD
ncbi:hypothetical protein POM88_047251 [Heracleum sosnowskyi]|uniref:Uncharacterized protein n=1 Tax=Heracleum sosnowskyi TaxID=360622 RepID=A0AAD8GTR5_9APIA|nr:hypothetical protein POM88_047251 [Heracleum sosnowskyi]